MKIEGRDVDTYTPDDPRAFLFVDTYYIEDEDGAYFPWKAGRPHAVVDDSRLAEDGNVEIYADPILFVTATPAGAIVETERWLCVGRMYWADGSGNQNSDILIGTREALLANGVSDIRRLEDIV